jgi:hypothetical protein
MPLTVSIEVSQSAIAPSNITVTDTSTGSDASVAERRIYLWDAYGEYLTGDDSVSYDVWPYADSEITLDVLTETIGDQALNLRVDWVDSGGTALYTDNNNYPFPQWGKQFFVYLLQQQGLTPGVYQDLAYSGNLAIFWTNLVGGINQVETGNDISGGQNCFNRTNQMRLNENTYF